ncbi:MAG TPA: glycosyltransferase family 39 protein [Dehalococcoidia bacterium]|nr:glycosyltransferase family 39 protein [Dehalococcoidia bacterium]
MASRTSLPFELHLSGRRLLYLEIGAVLAAGFLLLLFTLPNLANHPVPTDDEVWILSASHKLATEGVFGTDLFAGFYRADEVYLFNMPLHHIVLAAAFKVFGTSILLARLVSVLYGLAALGLVYLLAKQVGGVAVGVLALVLMLLLRLNIGFDTGLPLQEMARTIRYDLAPVPFTLAAALILLRPSPWRCAIAGGLLSIATLMQFYGFFMLPIAAAYLLWDSTPLRTRLTLVGITAVASMAVAAPYAVYVVANYHEFEGQTSTLERRIHFTDPDFYITNVERETKRFPFQWNDAKQVLTNRPSARLAVLIGLPAAAALAGWTAFRQRTAAHRLLFLTLVGLPVQFAVLDSPKIYFYWIAVMPFLCIGLSYLIVTGLRQLPPLSLETFKQPLRHVVPVGLAGLAAGFLMIVLVEGSYAQLQGARAWDDATDYLSLRDRLDDSVPPDAKVVGATALWWAMPDTDFRSYYMLFYSTNINIAEEQTTITNYLDDFGVEYIVLNRTSRMFLRRLISDDEVQFATYLSKSGERIDYFEDRSYGFIEVWRIDRSTRPR